MGGLLRLIEPRVAIALAVSLLLLVGTWAGGWRAAQARLAEAESSLAVAEVRLEEARELVDSTIAAGLLSAQDVADAIRAMEENIPEEVDDLELARAVSTFAAASGVGGLQQWDPLPIVRIDGNASTIPYQFRVQGDLAALNSFLNGLPGAVGGPATFREVELAASRGGAITFGEDNISMSGVVDIWIYTGNRISAPTSQEGGSEAPPGQDDEESTGGELGEPSETAPEEEQADLELGEEPQETAPEGTEAPQDDPAEQTDES